MSRTQIMWNLRSGLIFWPAIIIFLLPGLAVAQQSEELVFLLKGRGNVFWKTIRDGVEEGARQQNVSVAVLHTDDDQTPEAQLNICQTVLSRNPKVLVLGAATRNVGIECFKKASAAGVLVADIDGNVTIEQAKAAGVNLAFSVTSNNFNIGKQAGNLVAKDTRKSRPRILVLKGLPGSIVSEERARGFIEEISHRVPGSTIVATPTTDWDRLKAMNISLDYMERETELDYIFSVSDVMSLGVVEAVRVAEKEGRVKIVSVDGIADSRKAVLAGKLLATVAQLPYLMGQRAVELALRATKDKIAGVTEFTPIPVLTKEVLEANSAPELQYVR
jgi:D-allose transport system substrate-binding protein